MPTSVPASVAYISKLACASLGFSFSKFPLSLLIVCRQRKLKESPQTRGGGGTRMSRGYQARPKNHVIRVVFQDQALYARLLSQLGPKPTRPKPSRPKTNSAQNQVGPKPTWPKTHSALDYEILLLSSSLSSFLFLLLPSFVLCTGNLFHLKDCQSDSIHRNLEIWSAVTFKLLLWCELKCTVWNGNES